MSLNSSAAHPNDSFADIDRQLRRSNLTTALRRLAGNGFLYFIMVVLALIFMIPLLWMFTTSLKTRQEIFVWPPTWLPAVPQWDNYADAFAKYPLARFMLNSAILVMINALGEVISVPLIAFAFARLRFPGKRILFIMMLSTMMIPGQIKLIPLFSLFSRLGLIGTYWPLVLPSFFGNPFFIFLMVQYMRTIPRDLDEAARIDGASTWTILYRIILPLSLPAVTVMLVFTFLWTWNDFISPLIYLSDFNSYPISVGLAFFQGRYGVEWNMFMAATLISIIPVLVLYFFAQRHLIGGISTLGLKG
ncbi:MAG: carbohydrate ABC transporter permease [Anaerolineae bacterium]|nr:carbohydrate ABC transporter permease [Anaerolineae bacterium]NUQ03691.1 carbohydrate ABC transporter permease [Anaerolineae bacterium]